MNELQIKHLGLATLAIQEAGKPVDIHAQTQSQVHLIGVGIDLQQNCELINGKFCPSLGMGWVLCNDGGDAPHDEGEATTKVYSVIIIGKKFSIGIHKIPLVKKSDSTALVAA